MIKQTIGFIGAGNMATSLIGGLIQTGIAAEKITISDPNNDKMQQLSAQYGVNISENNAHLAKNVDIVILAVKPQQLREVCLELRQSLQETTRSQLFVSIAAGVTTQAISNWLGGKGIPLVRCMPNTPALVQTGATALYAGKDVSSEQRTWAESIMRAVGLVLWVDKESDMDAVTALSGSGPAYFFLVIEALQAAGEKLGLSHQTAHLLALQTALGAAKMALESDDEPGVLRERVTSPGGTTEKAIAILRDGGLEVLFERALKGAMDRSVELAELLGKE